MGEGGFQLGTVGALTLSVVSSVSIVICNKALMSSLHFIFGTFSLFCFFFMLFYFFIIMLIINRYLFFYLQFSQILYDLLLELNGLISLYFLFWVLILRFLGEWTLVIQSSAAM
jgi:hypothetical protein